ncbi:MAG: histidinol-phosphatase [Oscillospiraceae bacterium]|nr:histidinol-phosphatase [Oscillospiraceae bacterium]
MIVNLHTHTARCHHAVGTDEEYVLAAIDRGLKTLGFSDHTPHCYPDGFVSGVRMTPQELPEYAGSIRTLKEKYADKITIHLGVEAEYFPDLFPDTVSLLRDNGVEYMLLGQHFPLPGGNPHFATPTEDEAILRRYCDLVIEAMETGLFTYIAHPDFVHFVGDGKVYERHMRRVCRTANGCGIPLEINMLGLRLGRHYPNNRFFSVAAEEGCKVVLGSDVHNPEDVLLPENETQAMEIVDRFGLDLVTQPQIRRI